MARQAGSLSQAPCAKDPWHLPRRGHLQRSSAALRRRSATEDAQMLNTERLAELSAAEERLRSREEVHRDRLSVRTAWVPCYLQGGFFVSRCADSLEPAGGEMLQC